MSLVTKVKHEATLVALVTAYFAITFLFVGVVKMLFLAEFGVSVFDIAKPLLGALVVGKVVVLLDNTSLGDRFSRHSLWLDVLYKAAVYSSVVILVVFFEELWHHREEAESLRGIVKASFADANLSRFLGTSFSLYAIFVGYALLKAVADHFGGKRLLEFLVDRNARSPLIEK